MPHTRREQLRMGPPIRVSVIEQTTPTASRSPGSPVRDDIDR